jgi:membrane-bound lytic murein transglycosylase F
VIICQSGCTSHKDRQKETAPPFYKDLGEIKKDGRLRALTTYSGTSYFLYRGKAMGFEYELLERFAQHLGLGLEITVTSNIDSMFSELNDGHVDLVAHGLTITAERKKQVSFTDFLYLTQQVLVQKKPDNWRKMKWIDIENALVHDAIELIEDTVSVRRNTAYFQRLNNLSEEIGDRIFIDTLPGHLSTDEIIKMVVDGDIKYTVADQNIASINASYYPILDIDVPISFSQRVGWAVRPNAPKLLEALNHWIDSIKNEVDYYVIYNKYFKNEKRFRKQVQSEFYSLNNKKISRYDDLIRKHAEKIGWDWRLLASLVYQESQFDPKAGSWAGAAGLMQLMPATSKELGVKDRTNPEQNIRGGTAYLKQIGENFTMIEDSVQRIKFTMASFNCGYYHVRDAQNLAKHEGLNPAVWDDQVENIVLELSYPENYNNPVVHYGYVRGIEPYVYVRQIFERFDHYRQFIDR